MASSSTVVEISKSTLLPHDMMAIRGETSSTLHERMLQNLLQVCFGLTFDVHEMTLANSITDSSLLFLQTVQYSVALKGRFDILLSEYDREHGISETRLASLTDS